MKLSTQLLAFAGALAPVMATDWHFLTYFPPSGQQFTSFSGNMEVPKLPGAGYYYLWPGLQPTDNSGVYQNVLDGRSGTWYFASGWCCSNPSLPWGGGFNTYEGDVVTFSNTKGASTWTSVVTQQGSSASATNTFALNDKDFNQAVFAIELDNVSWTFGPLVFTDVVITSTGTDTSFCTANPSNYNDATNFSVEGVTTVVGDGYVECHLATVALNSPK